MEQLITVAELSDILKCSKQTIYNRISKGVYVLNMHYYKPSPKTVLFIWSAIQKWLQGERPCEIVTHGNKASFNHPASLISHEPESLINI